MFTQATSAGVSALTYPSIDLSHKHTMQWTKGTISNHFALWSRTIYACQFFDSCRLPKKHEPASVVVVASAACRFCTSKITIKLGLYPPRNIFSPYTLQPPRQQEFQPASQLSPVVAEKHGTITMNHLSLPGTKFLLSLRPSPMHGQMNPHFDLSLH